MTFVVSAGAVQQLHRPPSMPSRYLRLADDFTADYAQIWRSQGSVRTTVDFLGRNIASLGLHTFRRVDDDNRERVRDSGLARLLSRPNPGTTAYRLIDSLVRDMGIYDRGYWLKMKAPGSTVPGWLVRLPPARVSPVGDGWMWPEAFEFNGAKGRRTFSADEVVYFRGYDPAGDFAGCSPIESLRQVLSEEFEAGRMRQQTMRNGARASGYLERPAGGPEWSTAARNRFARAWKAQYTGGGPEAGGTPILEDGMKFVAAQQTAKDLQYIETRKLTREEVAAAYFIPPTMVGVMDSATFSNVKEQHKHLYQDTLGPWLKMIADELNLQLVPEFAGEPGGESLYVEFNLEEKLRGSFEEQAAQLQTATGGPWMTRNEARSMRNLPAIEGGDELIVPLNVIEGGQASPSDSAPEPGAAAAPARALKLGKAGGRTHQMKAAAPELSDEAREEVAALLAAFFERQRKAVLSAVGAGGEWWDGERWNKELAEDLYGLAVSLSAEVGQQTAAALGFDPADYDLDRTLAFLDAVAGSRAEWINEATRKQVEAALADESDDAPGPAAVFDNAVAQRSGASAGAIVAAVVGFALVEAGKQVARESCTKTWKVTSDNPRASHRKMHGETVPIDAKFSNGLNWPGDPAKGADEVAGCECSVTVSME